VHGPFSHFLLEEKEKMGGALHQPSSWLKSLPARKGEYQLSIDYQSIFIEKQ
jgi:hypothetical protein